MLHSRNVTFSYTYDTLLLKELLQLFKHTQKQKAHLTTARVVSKREAAQAGRQGERRGSEGRSAHWAFPSRLISSQLHVQSSVIMLQQPCKHLSQQLGRCGATTHRLLQKVEGRGLKGNEGGRMKTGVRQCHLYQSSGSVLAPMSHYYC